MKLAKQLMLAGAAMVLAMPANAWAQNVRGVTANEIRIGTHVDLSGPITVWGVPQRNGHLMRVEEQNAKGGVHGRQIRMIVEDNGYDPKKGVLATQKLIQQDQVFAIVGALGTPVVLAALPIVEEAKVPHLFPGAPHKRTYDPFVKTNFALASPYDDMTRASVRYFISQRKKAKIAVIYQDDDFGKEILDAVTKQAQAMNVPVVASASYKRGDTQFSSQVAVINRAAPDVVFLGTVPRETVGIMTEMGKIGWKVDTVAPASACAQAVADLGKAAVEGLYVQCQYVPFGPNETAQVKAWQERYEKRFNVKPDVAATMSYNMQDIVIRALEMAGRDLTQDKFIAALENIRDYRDIFGTPPLTFTPTSHLGTRSTVLTVIKDGYFARVEREALSAD